MAMAVASPNQSGGSPAPAPVVPFTQAAHEHTEPFFDQTFTPTTSQIQVGPVSVPAFGYLRHVFVRVSCAGGALGGGALNADYPFNILQSIQLQDTNGAPIYGPLDGYATLWENIVGGYGFRPDPRLAPDYIGTINAEYYFRIPIEISHHDGLGALANQNSSANYQVSMAINTLANLITGGAPTAPTVRVRMSLEAWTLPNEVDRAGRPQAQLPPAHGTTMYHSQFQKVISVGDNTSQLIRTGNLIRHLVVIARNSSSVRTNGVFPDRVTLSWDARELLNDDQFYRRSIAAERLPAFSAMDTGVFIYSFDHSNENKCGDDSPTLWLPTVQATRLEFQGASATAGNLQIVTCDIAPGEVVPSERYVETSATGFQPQVGATVPNVQ
mgnify:CR=1 FL=1